MRKLKILFGDLAYYNRYTRSNLYTPLAVGFVATYVKQLYGSDVEIKIIKDPEEFIDCALDFHPDLIGLSLYYWNTQVNHMAIKMIRERLHKDVVIVYGGPSIDTDHLEQEKMFSRFPEVDAIVPNEGELGFNSIVRQMLSDRSKLWSESLDGVTYLRYGRLIVGAPVGLTLDLSTLKSPYLTGVLDEYLTGDYQPLIQTSRLCPYTCAFCVSGKTRGELRAFEIDQVKEEIAFVSNHFKDRPHFTFFIADENFGILPRDAELAEFIKSCSVDLGYPKNVFFYNDKRFTKTSHAVIESLSKINTIGLTLALQTENPETLKAIQRKNLTLKQMDEALWWAEQRGIPTTTELIFGLPFETKESFVDLLEKSVRRGFDTVLCHNLFVMDGIEMNRPAYRSKHKMNTMHRILGASYGTIKGRFVAESEEVVISTTHFSYKDFCLIRYLNFMFYTIYALSFYKWFFNYLPEIGVNLTEYSLKFMNPDPNESWPEGYLRFAQDFKLAFRNELFSSKDDLIKKHQEMSNSNGSEVLEPSRINVRFGARLIYLEKDWINEVLKKLLLKDSRWKGDEDQENVVENLLNICYLERIDLRNPETNNVIDFNYDILGWRAGKFKKPLEEFRIFRMNYEFRLDVEIEKRIEEFNRDFGLEVPEDYYYHALDFIVPRSTLLYNLYSLK